MTGTNRTNGTFSPKWRVPALAMLFTLLPSLALADYDGITEGRVAFFQGGGADGHFGFQLVGSPRLCSTGSDFAVWGLVGDRAGHDPNGVKATLALLMAAKLTGANVKVYAYNLPFGDCKVAAIDVLY